LTSVSIVGNNIFGTVVRRVYARNIIIITLVYIRIEGCGQKVFIQISDRGYANRDSVTNQVSSWLFIDRIDIEKDTIRSVTSIVCADNSISYESFGISNKLSSGGEAVQKVLLGKSQA